MIHPFSRQSIPVPRQDRTINFIAFISRDGLSAQMPCGKPQSQLQPKAFRGMRSGILGVQDERPPPKVGDPDFRSRSREYALERVEVEPETGITTAIYVETLETR